MSVATNLDNGKNHIVINESSDDDYVFNQGESVEFQYDADTWQMSSAVEEETAISRSFPAGSLTMGVKYAGFWSWSGQPSYLIQDANTQTWREITTRIPSCKEGYELKGKNCYLDKKIEKAKHEDFSFISIPWFSDEKNGIAIVSFSDYNFWSGNRTREVKIISTNDSGNSWVKTDFELPNKFCGSLVTEVKDRLILSCAGYSSDFYESVDNGKTWQLVREQENF